MEEDEPRYAMIAAQDYNAFASEMGKKGLECSIDMRYKGGTMKVLLREIKPEPVDFFSVDWTGTDIFPWEGRKQHDLQREFYGEADDYYRSFYGRGIIDSNFDEYDECPEDKDVLACEVDIVGERLEKMAADFDNLSNRSLLTRLGKFGVCRYKDYRQLGVEERREFAGHMLSLVDARELCESYKAEDEEVLKRSLRERLNPRKALLYVHQHLARNIMPPNVALRILKCFGMTRRMKLGRMSKSELKEFLLNWTDEGVDAALEEYISWRDKRPEQNPFVANVARMFEGRILRDVKDRTFSRDEAEYLEAILDKRFDPTRWTYLDFNETYK